MTTCLLTLDNKLRERGFTLIEMIVVMVITGIIGGMVAVFITSPVKGYVDSARRAELTDIADTALRRIARDVRTAVPNSVRVVATSLVNATSTSCTATAAMPCYLEFIPTKDGGRYRAGAGGNNNILSFGTGGTTTFDIIGSAIPVVAGTDFIVIGSTQSDAVPPFVQTSAGILRSVSSMTNSNTTITFAAPALPGWAELESQRFDVVDGAQQAVTYACEGLGITANGTGTGQLKRYSGYGFAHVLPGTASLLAEKVSACTMEYDLANQRYGLLTMKLSLMSENEPVSLYIEIHVNNAP